MEGGRGSGAGRARGTATGGSGREGRVVFEGEEAIEEEGCGGREGGVFGDEKKEWFGFGGGGVW